MNKQTFLKILTREIKDLPKDEQKNALDYYSEYLNECDNVDVAIQNLAHPSEIAKNLCKELGITQKTKHHYTPLSIIGLVLLGILFGPILLSLLITLISIIVIIPASLVFASATVCLASILVLIPATFENPVNFLSLSGLAMLSFGFCLLFIKITHYAAIFIAMLYKKFILLWKEN